jgi:hypothetical protein
MSLELVTMVRDPILQTGSVAVMGAAITRIALQGHPTRRLVGQIVFFTALKAGC